MPIIRPLKKYWTNLQRKAEIRRYSHVCSQKVLFNAFLMTYAATTGSNITVVQGLENEVQALKLKSDMLENTVNELQKTVKGLETIIGMHQSLIEALRQHTVNFKYREETLDRGYQGEEYELMQ